MSFDHLPGELEKQQEGVTADLLRLFGDLWNAQQQERRTASVLDEIERRARVGVFHAADLAARLQLDDLKPGIRHPQVLVDAAEQLARTRASIIRDRAGEVLGWATANMVSPYARLAAQILVTDAARTGGKAAAIYGDATHKQFVRIRQVQEPRSHSRYEGTIRPIDGTWLLAGIEVDGPGDGRLPWSERAWCGHGLRYLRLNTRVDAAKRQPGIPISVAERPAQRTPEGSSIADKVSVDVSQPELAEAARAIDLASALHGDGPLPRLNITVGIPEDDELAAFIWSPETRRVFGIEVYPEYEAVDVHHELGHLLDAFGIGESGQYASHAHPALADWRAAIEATELVGILRARARSKVPVVRERAEYLLRPHELFARSYAQFIAITSGDASLRRDIGATVSTTFRPLKIPEQWSDDDFEAIAQAFDKLFVARGWWK